MPCAFPMAQQVKNPHAMQETRRGGFDPWVRKIPWRRKWQPIAVFLPENPMDRGAWQATIQRVAKSQTELNNRAHTHRPMEDGRRFHHATQNGLQFKTYELFLEFSI